MSSDVKRQRVCVFCVCCMLASAAVLRGGGVVDVLKALAAV